MAKKESANKQVPKEGFKVACQDCQVKTPTKLLSSTSLRLYGVWLCSKCFERREEKHAPKCSECNTHFNEPADKQERVTERAIELDDSGKVISVYLCNWCALSKGTIHSFVKRRGGEDGDFQGLKQLIDKLNIRTSEESDIPTAEEHEELVKYVNRLEWFHSSQKGEDFGENWKKYFISYTGFVYRTFSEPADVDFSRNPAWLFWHPDNPHKLVEICRVRIRSRLSFAYLEITFADPRHPTIDILNTQGLKTPAELQELWETPDVWTLFENVLKSAEGAKFTSPAPRAGSPIRWFFQALKGRNT